jgi:[protein-PII] uridylyltransferase
MTTATSPRSELRDLYSRESARIQQEFAGSGDGRTAVRQRTELVENLCLQLWNEIIAHGDTGPRNFALVATGGFGRGCLFPHSDIDLLFLPADRDAETAQKDNIRLFSQELWDLRLKVSPMTRTLAECDRFDPSNLEFTISLLDCRHLAGDVELFKRLHDGVIPKLVMRESQTLVQNLAEVTSSRHAKYGGTVFHLEPNIKEAPGGLRDHNVTSWLSLISAMDRQRQWPDPDSVLPTTIRRQFDPALDFLFAVRCFLHFRHGRDDNTLTWEAQDEAAEANIGTEREQKLKAADWMRHYFGYARSIHRVTTQLLEEIPGARSSLYRQFQNWRTRLSNADFSVIDGLIYLQQPSSLNDPEQLMSMFQFMAHHGLKLSTTTEHRVEQVLASLETSPLPGPEVWRGLREILIEPHAADALRAMHSLGVLTLLLPELELIDSLVVRDFYHRFTVDEHSFLAIESLHRARQSQSEWDQRYGQILSELEQPELLYLTFLLHDIGKGTPSTNHVTASLELAEPCLKRFELSSEDADIVRFLIGSHLDMSAALRRDIFDPENIRIFSEKMGTAERLKMLCLLTYADIKAVNPEALTPWKAESVWQLYIHASNYLNHSADQRLHVDSESESLAQLRTLAPTSGKKIKTFLEGVPTRYLRLYSADQVLRHLRMADQLNDSPVQIDLQRGRHWYDLTLVTNDRPFLFASVAGVLAAWGMNIVKANACSNESGVVIDTFYFTDTFRTLELNLPEWDRFKRSISDVLVGEADLESMLHNRMNSRKGGIAKVKVHTRIEFDDVSSSHSTLVQIIAQDQPGLLHRISSCFSEEDCSIEIALIDTEGQMAIDVFYLTSAGAKLSLQKQEQLKAALEAELAAS